MAVAAAETIARPWLLASQASPEAEKQATQDFTVFMGGIAVRGETQSTPTPEQANQTTLLSDIQMAAFGHERSRRMVFNNSLTDTAERLYKVANQSETWLKITDGHVEQEGRRMVDVSRNTLEHTVLIPEMFRRTTQDLKNIMVFQALQPTGLLEGYDVAIWSTTSTKMSDKQKRDYHLFLDTETCSVQLFSAYGEDVRLQTAFVAGKKTPDSPRQDIDAIKTLAEQKSMTITTDDGTDMLQHVMLVPKADIPNGVTDLVRAYDEAAGGTFYGEAKPRQDYLTYAEQCKARNQRLNSIAEAITAQIISEAHAFETPLEAIERLDYLSERFCVKYAVANQEVNAAVFGNTSAMHIHEARFFTERGDTARAEQSLRKAQQTADSGSCPLVKTKDGGEDGPDEAQGSRNGEVSGKKWGSCPYCKAKVFVDPCASYLSCWDCRAAVVNGKVTSKGDGGSKAREAKKAERQKAEEARLAKLVEAAFQEVNLEARLLDEGQSIRPVKDLQTTSN